MKAIKILSALILTCVAVLTMWAFQISPGTTDPIVDSSGNPLPNSIAESTMLELGGWEQFVLMRGWDTDNPILLLLHGGPGTPQAPLFNYYNQDLDEHFTLVNWDQRGAGRSYSAELPPETVNLEQLVEDTHELTQYLMQRFGKEKIYILGHSWGSYLAVRTVDLYPEDYYAYIGVGQIGNQRKSEMLSYDFVMNHAREINHVEAIQELEKLGAPVNGVYAGGMTDMLKQRVWVREFGGAIYNAEDFLSLFLTPIVFFREYTIADKLGYFDGELLSVDNLMGELMDFDAVRKIPTLNVPVYVLQGRHDYQTAFQVAVEFIENLQAPFKELIPFENSAHMPSYEEPGRFHDVMVNRVLKETYP
jgi:pimeloyl-ACP methyl ester carboxylesterase